MDNMSYYPEQLQKQIDDMEKANPGIKQLLDQIKEIKQRDSRDFDYEVERTHLLFNLVTVFLKIRFNKNRS